MRLIDAYALQNMIHKSKMENPHKDAKVVKNHELEHDHFMQMVVLQPTAQEEIVRCKDCKYRPTYPEAYGAEINGKWCYWCELHRAWKHDDWFCADGEK